MNTENRKPRTHQYSKEELLEAIEKFYNNKIAMAEHLGIGNWSLREQLKKHGINFDRRIDECKSRAKSIPDKEILEKLYAENNSLVAIGNIFGVSSVTVRKWFNIYEIECDSRSDTIKNRVNKKKNDPNLFNEYKMEILKQ